jgi:hypothetical protein
MDYFDCDIRMKFDIYTVIWSSLILILLIGSAFATALPMGIAMVVTTVLLAFRTKR